MSECFESSIKSEPKSLNKVSLGYVYQSSDGHIYIKQGKDEWLPVVGMSFGYSPERRLIKIFDPAVQLHIHSAGGKTITKATTQQKIKVDESYHAQEAAKKLKQKGRGRKAAQEYVSHKVAELIPRAPKYRRSPKGTGHGAPGTPRTPQGEEVVTLRNSGIPEEDAVNSMIDWYKQRGLRSKGKSIEKLVHRWYHPKKS